MKKKIAFIIVLCLLSIVNINASTINKENVNKKYKKLKNTMTGVIDIKDTLIPIGIIGGCLIIHNYIQNKK